MKDESSETSSEIDNIESKYQPGDDETVISAHLNYLQLLEQDENKRLDILDSKTSQIIAQTGIVFTLLGLLIPLIVSRIEELNALIKMAILLLLVATFIMYLRIISIALKNFDVKKFGYSRPSPKNVLTFQNRNLKEFQTEVINDLLFAVKHNADLNNIKADNLISAFNKFKTANILTGVLIILFSVSFFFSNPQTDVVSITRPVKVERLDSIENLLRNLKASSLINDSARVPFQGSDGR